MTWRFRVQGVFTSVAILALLALASGAQWIDQLSSQWLDSASALWTGLGW